MDSLESLLWSNPEYLDAIYKQYLEDPASVDASWSRLFNGAAEQPSADGDANRAAIGHRREHDWVMSAAPIFLAKAGGVPDGLSPENLRTGIQIYDLVHTFREYGHLIAQIDPLGRSQRSHPFLDLSKFGFGQADLDTQVSCVGFYGTRKATVREFIDILRETYCGPVGVEYMDLMEKEQRDWLQSRMEPVRNRPRFSVEKKRQILEKLIAADAFEENLHRMYPGTKRFSLEGATTLITMLDQIAQQALEHSVEQIVLGMAHRGRLNVLANFMCKPLAYILAEFEGRPLASKIQGYGDVKYHMGYSSDYQDEHGRDLHLSLAFNPSHLEVVNPVVEGIVRAKQQHTDPQRTKVVPVLIHGDAAFAGQGIVAETFTLGGLEGYATGGTLHIIVNNQVAFTANPDETRSTRYASDIAKTVRAPVFHVNADHPEAVALIAEIALGFRQRFHRDVVIDLVCFRRHGHNEMDDATFTQPLTAALIKEHEPVSRIYSDKLVAAATVSRDDVKSMFEKQRAAMQAARDEARTMSEQVAQSMGGKWQGIQHFEESSDQAKTAVSKETLLRIAEALVRVPEGFTWHKRLRRLMTQRMQSIIDGENIDWGAGEALALGSLVLEGTNVRFSGQDAQRGTFSHRHAAYTDGKTGERYVALNHLSDTQGYLEIINSPLSEEAVLGFEYGYSSADPWSLVIWEAQFGDFANGAQVIIDQLIATCEYKWGRMSGLVMLLPHGYEGQGPEHSSARLERYLELCAENNLQVCNFTTPAQFFHALRRQLHRGFRKPLVVMSPKSLLRHPAAVSTLSEFTDGELQRIIDDPRVGDRKKIKRLLYCTGKVYYSLAEAKHERKIEDVAIIRLEQIYPYPIDEARTLFSSYPNLKNVVWVQEEPRNMGAWRHMRHTFERSLPDGVSLHYAGRDSRAATATGAIAVHKREEAELIDAAYSCESTSQVVRRKRDIGAA